MKSIILFFRGIRASVKANPIIYGIFLLFYIFTTVTMIYVVGKYSSNLSAYDDYDASLSTFSVDYGLLSEIRFSDIRKTVQDYAGRENVGYIEVRFLDTLDINAHPEQYNVPHYAIAYADNEFEMTEKYFENSGINDVDISTFTASENCMILVDDALTAAGDFFAIQNRPYKVIKRIPWGDEGAAYHLVSYNSMLKNDPVIREISIKFNIISGFVQFNDIKNTLSVDFPGAEIKEPVLRDYNVESIFSIGNIMVYLVIALSLVNIFYIFRVIYESRRSQYEIMSLYGCTSRKITSFAAAEILLLVVVQTFAGIFLFHFAIRPIIISLEPLLKYTFHMKLYLTVSGISTLFCFTALIIEVTFLQKRKVGAVR